MKSVSNISENAADLKIIRLDAETWKFFYEYAHINESNLNILHEGEALLKAGKLDAAETAMTRFLKIYPGHMMALSALAFIHYEKGDPKKSLCFASEAIHIGLRCLQTADFLMDGSSLDSKSPENHPFLHAFLISGSIKMESGALESAVEAFETILKLDHDDYYGARSSAIECYLTLCQPERAYEICKKYSRLDDKCIGTLYGMPLVLLRLGRNAEAERAIKQAVMTNPKVAVQLIRQYTIEAPQSPRVLAQGNRKIAEHYRRRIKNFGAKRKGRLICCVNTPFKD